MKKVSLPSGEYLLVEVPEDAQKIMLTNIQVDTDIICPDGFGGMKYLGSTPPGNWQIIGKAYSLNRKEWNDIVQYFPLINDDGHFCGNMYRDYTDVQQIVPDDFSLDTPTESGLSLLASHSMKPETTLIIKHQP